MLHRVSEMWSCVAHSVKVWEKWEETAGAWRGGCRPADKGAYEAAPHDTLTHTHNTQHDMTLITAEIDLTLLKTVCRGKELSENSGAGIKGGKPSVLKKCLWKAAKNNSNKKEECTRYYTDMFSYTDFKSPDAPEHPSLFILLPSTSSSHVKDSLHCRSQVTNGTTFNVKHLTWLSKHIGNKGETKSTGPGFSQSRLVF